MVAVNGKAEEKPVERGARLMGLLTAEERGELQVSISRQLGGERGMNRMHKCNDMIDFAITGIARETIANGTDFTPENKAEFKEAIKASVSARLAATPDTGWKLGE